MSTWIVVLLGVIEGITEFLPISSTGHLLLAEHALKLSAQPSEMFNVVIQCGAVLAVLLAFSQRLKQMVTDWKKPETRDYIFKLTVAFFVTSILALALKKFGLKLPETTHPVAWATLIGGVVILVLEKVCRDWSKGEQVTWTIAIAVGLAQVLAVAFPGTSRSGASIMMALAIGLSRPAATEFAFLLGIPTLLAAGGYSILSAIRHGEPVQESAGQIILGTLVAAITAFVAVRWLLRYVRTHTFIPFGWYRIALGGLILVFAR